MGSYFNHQTIFDVVSQIHFGTRRKCRIHKIGNMYAAGPLVFSTTGYVNPTLTIVALALRLADHLKKNFA